MYDPFESSDALVRDLPHVRVTRRAGGGGRRCTYEKIFKPDGLPDADYWARRENELLSEFAREKLRHAVERVPEEYCAPGEVATYDAGVTVEDWLRVRPGYADGTRLEHPFQSVGQFLKLIRACLYALKEIHRLGIVHCDLKPENICLPYISDGQRLSIDYKHIKLIDFSFSIVRDRPLELPLPLLPTAPYQSPELQQALLAGRNQTGGLAAQNLLWRVDFYSLGHFAWRIARAGLVPPPGTVGGAAWRAAHDLPARLQDFGRLKVTRLPHNSLIAEINGWLEQMQDANESFERLPPTPKEKPDEEEEAIPDPMELMWAAASATPVALPGSIAAKPRWRRPRPVHWLAALGLAGAAAGAGYAILHAQGRPGPSKPAPQATAPAAEPAAKKKPEPPAAQGTEAEANTLYLEKNYGQALPIYQRLAEAGNANAQTRLGLMHEQGLGTAKNDAKAAEWYAKAAAQGSEVSLAALGWLYAQGQGVPKDEAAAAALSLKAAQLGSSRAQGTLGWLFEQGKGGLAKDEAKAASLYLLAARNGETDAQYRLGLMYEEGRGVEKNPAQAREWLGKAADKGHADALAALKRLP